MDGCPATGFTAGFFSGGGLGPCSGRGTCVNATAATAGQWATLCACDADSSGAVDFFDLRVAVDPSTGATLALNCPVPVVLSTVSYAFLLSCVLFRELTALYALYIKLVRLPEAQRVTSASSPQTSWTATTHAWRVARAAAAYAPTRILAMDAFVVMPFMIAFGALKLASGGERLLGSDAAVTTLFGFGVFWMLALTSAQAHNEFAALAKSRMLKSRDGSALVTNNFRRAAAEHAVYIFAMVVIPLSMLSLDRSAGPIANGEVWLLVGRNAIIVFTYAARNVDLRALRREVDAAAEVFSDLSRDNDEKGAVERGSTLAVGTGTAGARGDALLKDRRDAVSRILVLIKRHSSEVRKTTFVVFTFYTLFALPWFWAYQTPVIGFIVPLGILSGNVGMTYVRARWAADTATSSSNAAALGATAAKGAVALGATPRCATAMSSSPAHLDDVVVGSVEVRSHGSFSSVAGGATGALLG